MHAPMSEKVLRFMQQLDERLGMLHDLGATVAVTGDHGMSAKSLENGDPDILFLEDFSNLEFPEAKARVICPIADPFVKHHGSLGGFVRVYLGAPHRVDIEKMLQACRQLPQVGIALTGEEAASRYEMPLECEGEMVVISTKGAVIGSRKDEHDLSWEVFVFGHTVVLLSSLSRSFDRLISARLDLEMVGHGGIMISLTLL